MHLQASLAWTPPLVRFLKAILRLPFFLLFDFYSHSQQIRVPVITKKALRTFAAPRITSALVQVGRPGLDGTLPGELQVYSAKLRFVAHLTGLRWLMYYHRIISFFLFCGVFFAIALFTALILWAAAGYLYAQDSDLTSEGANTDITSVKTEDVETKSPPSLLRRSSSMKAGKEDPTRRELQDQARRLAQARNRQDAFLHSGTDTEAEDEGGVLRHLQFGIVSIGSESESEPAVIIKRESENASEDNSPNWQGVSFSGNETVQDVKKEEPESSTPSDLAGEMSPSPTGQDSSSSARLARERALRRRASNRSMKEKSTE